MRFLLFNTVGAVILLTSGCDSPHVAISSVQKQVVEVDGSTFSVRIKGDFAEAIRTNFEFRPKARDIQPKAERAMEIASGCRVRAGSMRGDPALMVAKLDC